ncbi:universal stress protein [Propioniciclava sinopodophylli]|uniref:universal stress protein n=1 Tax=Propioniciclava sinopodophylli TaxID=1837344 RepID=UPI0024938E1F|nr:universal stress protein [Propioniciclava sinopodophylli]
MTPYGCIVVGTDGSALSDPTVARASVLAAAEEADLVIVCAYSGMTMREGAKATATLGDTRTSVVLGREAASDALATATSTASGLGAQVKASLLVEGEADSALLRAAQQHEADLIVIGAIRDTSLAGRLLGTVASAVVREAPCEVLVVRPPAAWGDVTEIEVPEDV